MIGKCCITQTYRREPWEKFSNFDAQARLGKVKNATQIETDTLVRRARAQLSTGPGRERHPE